MRALRNGFEPLFRLEVYDRLKHLETGKCPFDNLPERKRTPWSITREENEKLRLAQARIGCTNQFAEWRWRTNYGILGLLGCGEGKAVITCNNPLKHDMSGLVIGTTSGAEEVARLAPRAKVVEVLFPFAELLHSGSVAFGAE